MTRLVLLLVFSMFSAWYFSHDIRLDADIERTRGLWVPACRDGGVAVVMVMKPSAGDEEVRIRQVNAYNSWLLAFPDAELFVAGDKAMAASVGATFVDADTTPTGTLLLDSLLAAVRARTGAGILAYANADIVVTGGLRVATEHACREASAPFLLVGRRFEVPVRGETLPLAVGEEAEALARLRALEHEPGAHMKDGMNKDYFIFSRDAWPAGALPGIAVGRAEIDNYLVQDAVARGLWVVDASAVQRAYHQTHSYGHLAGGKFQAYEGPEALSNRAIMTARFGRKVRPLAHIYNVPRVLRCATPPEGGGGGGVRGGVRREEEEGGRDPHCALHGWAIATDRVWTNEVSRGLFHAGVFNLWYFWIGAAVALAAVWAAWIAARRMALLSPERAAG